MLNLDDLNKADENLNELCKIRDQLIKASPLLNELKSKIDWFKKVCTEIPERSNDVLGLIEMPILGTIKLTPNNLDHNILTGATGSFYAASGDTRQIIRSYGSEHYNLINEYDVLNKTEELIDKIVAIVGTYREYLREYKPCEILIEAKNSYSKWQVGAIDNSSLAKDIRAFQDVFNGILKRAWVQYSYKPIPKKFPDFSWPKISQSLGKAGGGCKKALEKLQHTDEDFHLQFTEILKKTIEVDKATMDRLFKDYIEHVYAIVNLIDQQAML